MKYRYKYGTPFSGANAEVEGGEMIETPQGQVSEVEGASHEAGGVDTELQKGTKVYSDRIKIGEHTIADRKKYRTERIKKLLEKLGDKTDGLSRNTMKRNLAFFKLQEEHDLTVQNAAKEMLQPQGQTQQLAYGTPGFEEDPPEWVKYNFGGMARPNMAPEAYLDPAEVNPYNINSYRGLRVMSNMRNNLTVTPRNWRDTPLGDKPASGYNDPSAPSVSFPHEGEYISEEDRIANKLKFKVPNVSATAGMVPMSEMLGKGVTDYETPLNPSGKVSERFKVRPTPVAATGAYDPTGVDGKDENSIFTTGDWIGLAGMAVGAGTQLANTIQNAKATKKAVNYWEGFNTNALGANQEAIDEVGYQKDIAVRGTNRMIDINTNNARQRVRGSARGIGTLRALDLGVDATANEAQIAANNNLEATFGGQKQNLINNKIGLLTQRDQMERMGQDKVDEINQANLDNFYTNFGQNLADMSTNIQAVGGMVNQSKQNADFLKILPQTNRWGIGFDADGDITFQGKKYTEKK